MWCTAKLPRMKEPARSRKYSSTSSSSAGMMHLSVNYHPVSFAGNHHSLVFFKTRGIGDNHTKKTSRQWPDLRHPTHTSEHFESVRWHECFIISTTQFFFLSFRSFLPCDRPHWHLSIFLRPHTHIFDKRVNFQAWSFTSCYWEESRAIYSPGSVRSCWFLIVWAACRLLVSWKCRHTRFLVPGTDDNKPCLNFVSFLLILLSFCASFSLNQAAEREEFLVISLVSHTVFSGNAADSELACILSVSVNFFFFLERRFWESEKGKRA